MLRYDVQLRNEMLDGALPKLDPRFRAAKRSLVHIARLRFPVPSDVERHMRAANGISNRIVAIVIELAILNMRAERGRELLFPGDTLEIGLRNYGRPAPRALELNVFLIIDAVVGKRGPLHQIDDVRADVGEPFAVLVHVEKPDRPPQGHARYDLHQVMNAARRHRRLVLGARDKFAEHAL